MADKNDCADSERGKSMPPLQSAKTHMACKTCTHHVGALLGSNIIDKAYNTFVSSSAAAVALCRPSLIMSGTWFIDSWLETREVLIEHVCTDLAQVQSVGSLQINRNPITPTCMIHAFALPVQPGPSSSLYSF